MSLYVHLSILHRCVIYSSSPDLQWWYYLSFVIEIIARLNAQNRYLTIEICFLKDFYHDPVIYLINSLVFTLNMNGNTIQLHRTIKILLKWPVCFIILLFCTVLLKIAFVKHCAIIQCHLPFVDRELKTQTRARALEITTLGRYMYAQLKSQLVQGRPFDLLNVILTACLWTTMSRMN